MQTTGKLWRSRWAAIGAALAVTFGAGGLYSVRADSPSSAFVAIAPVRVLDTRLPSFGGPLASAAPRNLQVTGSISTVGADGTTVSTTAPVPVGATAIVANVTAVFPTTAGFVSVRPGTATGNPTTSNINFTAGGVVIPNSVTVELPTTGATAGEVQLFFQGLDASATTELLVDIVGYYEESGAGPRGLSAWDVIPSGTTVKGQATWDVSPASLGTADAFSVELPGVAPVPLTDATVNFAPPELIGVTPDTDATCTGTVANPTAPAGKVCIYIYGATGMLQLEGGAPTYLADRAFEITWLLDSDDVQLYATWAYTAP
jgi:hypothetical protein